MNSIQTQKFTVFSCALQCCSGSGLAVSQLRIDCDEDTVVMGQMANGVGLATFSVYPSAAGGERNGPDLLIFFWVWAFSKPITPICCCGFGSPLHL